MIIINNLQYRNPLKLSGQVQKNLQKVAKAQYSKHNFPYFGGQTLRWANEYAMGPFVIIDQEKNKNEISSCNNITIHKINDN